MLEDLRIRGLGVIDDAMLSLGPGLTVVTGETGAGKTMVVTALSLLFGRRAVAERVRAGAEQASVEATLILPRTSAPAVRAGEAGGELDELPDAELAALTLRRVVSAAGRSRAYVGGAGAPVAVLADIGASVFALHGQSDQLRLAHAGEQLSALDRYAAIDRAPLRDAYGSWRTAVETYEQRVSHARELEREADLLRHGLAEIEAVAPRLGEDAELAQQITRLSSADELRIAATQAHDALAGDSGDPQTDALDVRTLLAQAQRALSGQASQDPALVAASGRLADLLASVHDIADELRQYGEALAADPDALATAMERQAQLRSLTRRYGDDLPGVLAWLDETRDRLERLDTSEAALEQLAKARDAAAAELTAVAQDVSARREKAAARLADAITAEIRELAMPTATIEAPVARRTTSPVSVDVRGAATPVTADGIDQVELLLRAHEGAPAVSLQRGASGGELSRVMLAVEVVLAASDPVPTMVFDEVDAGVGGRAAIEVGRRLARLARDRQVIVVTHLAQVAAYADAHLVIDKRAGEGAAGVTRSDVRRVEGPARRAELARMLSGRDTATARRHAGELLAQAQGDRGDRLESAL